MIKFKSCKNEINVNKMSYTNMTDNIQYFLLFDNFFCTYCKYALKIWDFY